MYVFFHSQAQEFENERQEKQLAAITAVGMVAMAGCVAFALASTVFFWPVVVVGVAFGWKTYSNLCPKDRVRETFYLVCGGKDKFEQLPKIELEQDHAVELSQTIRSLKWEDLKHSIAKSKTLDGRKIVIIKGFTNNNEAGKSSNCETKAILAFVEKIGKYDLPSAISNLDEFAEPVLIALNKFKGNSGPHLRWRIVNAQDDDRWISSRTGGWRGSCHAL